MSDRNTRMKEIAETGFFLDDLKLYLDTHPLDQDALNTFAEYAKKRRTLLKEYAEQFEPLTCDCICPENNDSAAQKHWTWCGGPIPWDREASDWAAGVTGGNAAKQNMPAAAAPNFVKGGQ